MNFNFIFFNIIAIAGFVSRKYFLHRCIKSRHASWQQSEMYIIFAYPFIFRHFPQYFWKPAFIEKRLKKVHFDTFSKFWRSSRTFIEANFDHRVTKFMHFTRGISKCGSRFDPSWPLNMNVSISVLKNSNGRESCQERSFQNRRFTIQLDISGKSAI